MIECFAANKLILNPEKTNIMKPVTSNSPHCALTIGYKDKCIEERLNSKFLGLPLDNHLNWEDHIHQMIPELSGACYALRSMFHISNINTLTSIYFAYFQVFIQYAIIFGGNCSNNRKISALQKKIIKIMVGARPRTPCRSLFRETGDFACPMPIYIFISELLF
jgi:hypothetical protein